MILIKIPRNRSISGLRAWRLGAGSRAACLALVMLLPACAPLSERPAVVGSEHLQSAREAQLLRQATWSFSGRLAVSQGSNGGNASIRWRQDGADFDITLSAPITRQSWRLKQVGGTVRLQGLEGGLREGPDAEALLLEATGWRIPLAALAAWVRGVRAPGPSQLSFDKQGLPATISQAGWAVEYRSWTLAAAALPALPLRLSAGNGEARVKLVVESWNQP